jgi:hypothetical protein
VSTDVEDEHTSDELESGRAIAVGGTEDALARERSGNASRDAVELRPLGRLFTSRKLRTSRSAFDRRDGTGV